MRLLFGVLITAVLTGPVMAQTPARLRPPAQGELVDGPAPYAAPATTSEAVLEEMSGRAAVIFTGIVTAVRLPADTDGQSNPAAGSVEIQFAVAQGIRGAVSGGTYVLREWAGLWADGPRFQVGQRRLMLLHAPGPSGLSSPVDGLDGVIPISGGAVDDAAMASSGAMDVAGVNCADMRWLEARTLRNTVSAAADVKAQASVAAVVNQPGVDRPLVRVVAGPPVAHLVGVLKAWEAVRNATR